MWLVSGWMYDQSAVVVAFRIDRMYCTLTLTLIAQIPASVLL